MGVLVCNTGSSTLELSLFAAASETLVAVADVDWHEEAPHVVVRRAGEPDSHSHASARTGIDAVHSALAALGSDLHRLAGVGHRVVHGGDRFREAVRITPEVERTIDGLGELAPLHNPVALEAIRAMTAALPQVPQVATFDTAFHATLPPEAYTYAIPRMWTREWGLRRYGFHGLSHAYCAQRAADLLGRSGVRVVVAHLGNGASVSAVASGRCVDTTMGFTPLEGLMMGTRSGDVDPGLLLHVLRRHGVDADRLDHALQHESGLLGVSGLSSDMRAVLAAAPSDPDAALAIGIYVHRVRQAIGAAAATLGGIDALVFTAGVGEHAAEIRARVCDRLGHLGLALDARANAGARPDADVATAASPARILVIASREDLTILRETRRVLALAS